VNGVFAPELPPDESEEIWNAVVELSAWRRIECGGNIWTGWSANIARLNQPCLRPPRWSDPQVRRMFCLPGLWIAVLAARCAEMGDMANAGSITDEHLPSVLP
jgi:hypothetical protein